MRKRSICIRLALTSSKLSIGRTDALTLAKLGREFDSSNCDASIVQDHYILGQEVGLSGTPAIVLEDGELIAGYLPPDALKARLQQKAAEPEKVSASQ